MQSIKAIGVKELKNNLSFYLREVRLGVRILVTDRDSVVAELSQPFASGSDDSKLHPLILRWVQEGKLKLGKSNRQKLGRSPVTLPPGTTRKLLDAERDE